MRRGCHAAILAGLLGYTVTGFCFEDAQVLPKGIRRAEVKLFHTKIDTKTNGTGKTIGIGDNLQKDVTYKDFINNRSGYDKSQLEAFLKSNDIEQDRVVGGLKADVTGIVSVFAPTFSYGVSDRFSFGFALPIYTAATDVDVAFDPNNRADEFVSLLNSPKVGLSHKAQEAVDAINEVTDTLDGKLADNGYQPLEKWSDTGLGDFLLKGKYQFLNMDRHRLAVELGGRLPTGRNDDPDILTDIAFGDGTYDIFGAFFYDLRLNNISSYTPFFLNTFARYTYQAPTGRQLRMKTQEESLEVEKKYVSYKLGDMVDTGASFQLDSYFGLLGGIGYNYYYKFQDNYHTTKATAEEYESDTKQWAHRGEAMFGYSSINAYRRGTFFVPFTTLLVYQRHLESINMPIQHLWQLDMKVFF